MEKQLRQWLENASQTPPGDFYQLLGCHRFHPDQSDLSKAIRVANRFLHRFQNHDDQEIVRRARNLQVMVAEAEDIFSDQQRWSAYDEELIQELRHQWDRRTTGSWHREDLRRWLVSVQQVDPQRADSLIEVFLKFDGAASSGPQPQQPSSKMPGTFWEQAFPAPKNPAPRKPNPRRHAPAPQSSNSNLPPSRGAATQPKPATQDAEGRKTTGPPPRKARRGPPARPGREAKPVPAAPRPAPVSSHRADNSTMAAFHAQRRQPSSGTGLLWIFGSAIATVFVLGLVALIIFLIVMVGK